MNPIRLDSLPPTTECALCLKDLFSQTLHKSLKDIATSTTVFTIKYEYLHFARILGLLLETQMRRFAHRKVSCDCGSGGVRIMAVLLCFLSAVGCLFDCLWSYWELMNRRFFLCLFIVCHFICWRWSGRTTWSWGFSFQHCKWHFYHINLQYAVQLCWFLGD